MTVPRITLVGCVLVVAIANASCAAQAEEYQRCIYPDPHTLLGGKAADPNRVDYLLFDTKTGPMRWLFVSSEIPQDGLAFVLACDGHVIAKRRVGYVSLYSWGQPGRFGPGSGTDITTTSMSNTGILTQSESWLQFDGKAINILWTHVIWVTPGGPVAASTTDTYQWTYYYPPKNEIRVTGTRKKVHDDGTSPIALPTEKYCYRSNVNRFVRC